MKKAKKALRKWEGQACHSLPSTALFVSSLQKMKWTAINTCRRDSISAVSDLSRVVSGVTCVLFGDLPLHHQEGGVDALEVAKKKQEFEDEVRGMRSLVTRLDMGRRLSVDETRKVRSLTVPSQSIVASLLPSSSARSSMRDGPPQQDKRDRGTAPDVNRVPFLRPLLSESLPSSSLRNVWHFLPLQEVERRQLRGDEESGKGKRGEVDEEVDERRNFADHSALPSHPTHISRFIPMFTRPDVNCVHDVSPPILSEASAVWGWAARRDVHIPLAPHIVARCLADASRREGAHSLFCLTARTGIKCGREGELPWAWRSEGVGSAPKEGFEDLPQSSYFTFVSHPLHSDPSLLLACHCHSSLVPRGCSAFPRSSSARCVESGKEGGEERGAPERASLESSEWQVDEGTFMLSCELRGGAPGRSVVRFLVVITAGGDHASSTKKEWSSCVVSIFVTSYLLPNAHNPLSPPIVREGRMGTVDNYLLIHAVNALPDQIVEKVMNAVGESRGAGEESEGWKALVPAHAKIGRGVAEVDEQSKGEKKKVLPFLRLTVLPYLPPLHSATSTEVEAELGRLASIKQECLAELVTKGMTKLKVAETKCKSAADAYADMWQSEGGLAELAESRQAWMGSREVADAHLPPPRLAVVDEVAFPPLFSSDADENGVEAGWEMLRKEGNEEGKEEEGRRTRWEEWKRRYASIEKEKQKSQGKRSSYQFGDRWWGGEKSEVEGDANVFFAPRSLDGEEVMEDVRMASAQLAAVPTFLIRQMRRSTVARVTLLTLDLSFNAISALPADIGLVCHSLTHINVSHNRLDHLPSSLAYLSSLSTVTASYNYLRSFPSYLLLSSSPLSQLLLASNIITHARLFYPCTATAQLSPVAAVPIATLEVVDLSSNNLTSIEACPPFLSLRLLDLSCNPSLASLPLSLLNLDYNKCRLRLSPAGRLAVNPLHVLFAFRTCARKLIEGIRRTTKLPRLHSTLPRFSVCGMADILKANDVEELAKGLCLTGRGAKDDERGGGMEERRREEEVLLRVLIGREHASREEEVDVAAIGAQRTAELHAKEREVEEQNCGVRPDTAVLLRFLDAFKFARKGGCSFETSRNAMMPSSLVSAAVLSHFQLLFAQADWSKEEDRDVKLIYGSFEDLENGRMKKEEECIFVHSSVMKLRGGAFFSSFLSERLFTGHGTKDTVHFRYSRETALAYVRWMYTASLPSLSTSTLACAFDDQEDVIRGEEQQDTEKGSKKKKRQQGHEHESGSCANEGVLRRDECLEVIEELMIAANEYLCSDLQLALELEVGEWMGRAKVDPSEVLTFAHLADYLSLPLLSAQSCWLIGRDPARYGLEREVLVEGISPSLHRRWEDKVRNEDESGRRKADRGRSREEEEGEPYSEQGRNEGEKDEGNIEDEEERAGPSEGCKESKGRNADKEEDMERTTTLGEDGASSFWGAVSKGFRLRCLHVRQQFEAFLIPVSSLAGSDTPSSSHPHVSYRQSPPPLGLPPIINRREGTLFRSPLTGEMGFGVVLDEKEKAKVADVLACMSDEPLASMCEVR